MDERKNSEGGIYGGREGEKTDRDRRFCIEREGERAIVFCLKAVLLEHLFGACNFILRINVFMCYLL
jgi:hypothetical protein